MKKSRCTESRHIKEVQDHSSPRDGMKGTGNQEPTEVNPSCGKRKTWIGKFKDSRLPRKAQYDSSTMFLTEMAKSA